jgi:hypothetical protein
MMNITANEIDLGLRQFFASEKKRKELIDELIYAPEYPGLKDLTLSFLHHDSLIRQESKDVIDFLRNEFVEGTYKEIYNHLPAPANEGRTLIIYGNIKINCRHHHISDRGWTDIIIPLAFEQISHTPEIHWG